MTPIPTHSSVRYEPKDVSAAAILKYFAALAGAIVVSLLIVSGTYGLFVRWRQSSFAAPVSSLPTGAMVPPEPRLQGAPGHEELPSEELRRLRSDSLIEIESYGWVNQKAGIARIPISEAMKMLVNQNPPAPSSATSKQDSR